MVKPFRGAPDCFIELHSCIDDCNHRTDCLNQSDIHLPRSSCGNFFNTVRISQAASKFLLAQNTRGILLEGYRGSEPEANYNGQLIFTVAVAAFETYCRLRGDRWHQKYRGIFIPSDGQEFRAVADQQNLAEEFYRRLKDAQVLRNGFDDNLRAKIDEFRSGADELNFYAICVGFRNAFSHGRLGTLNGILPMSLKARDIILSAIDRDCRNRAQLIF